MQRLITIILVGISVTWIRSCDGHRAVHPPVPGLPASNDPTTTAPRPTIPPGPEGPLYTDNYIPPVMQAVAHFIELLQYEPIGTTTIEPPFQGIEAEGGTTYSPPERPTGSTTSKPWWQTSTTTIRPLTTTSWWKPPSTTTKPTTVWWQTTTKAPTTTSSKPETTPWWQTTTKKPQSSSHKPQTTPWWQTTTKQPISDYTKPQTTPWWQTTTTKRPISTTSKPETTPWWQTTTTKRPISSSAKPQTTPWWQTTTKKPISSSSTSWWPTTTKRPISDYTKPQTTPWWQTTTTKRPISTTSKPQTTPWWQTTTKRPIADYTKPPTTQWWQTTTKKPTASSQKPPSTSWWPTTTKRPFSDPTKPPTTAWWQTTTTKKPQTTPWWQTTTTKRPSVTSVTQSASDWTTIWWPATSTKRPPISTPSPIGYTTPFHNPGNFAPTPYYTRPSMQPPTVHEIKLESTTPWKLPQPAPTERQPEELILGTLDSDKNFLDWLFQEKAKQYKPDIDYDFQRLDPLPAGLVHDILNEPYELPALMDKDNVNEFLRIYDDNYGKFPISGKKRIPPTKPYVELIMLYDLLKREAKAQNLNKYEGYTDKMIYELAELSKRSAERQLHTLFTRLLARRDVERSDIVTRIERIIKDLEDPNSITAKSIRVIPALKFIP